MQTVYFVNAFLTPQQPLSGNPAAVCLLQEWLPDATLQAVAEQHNVSETAYIVQMGPASYTIRWFTPTHEIDLCGHATLAAAHVLFEYFSVSGHLIEFESASGSLKVMRNNTLTLSFPVKAFHQSPVASSQAEQYASAFGLDITTDDVEVFSNGHASIIYCNSAQTIKQLTLNSHAISQLPEPIHYVTAAASQCDFVCRVFAPKYGILEDPVTGSAYTSLAPFWAARLNKMHMQAQQLSARGGHVSLNLNGDRVLISGEARTAIIGQWMIEPHTSGLEHSY
ncbi:PhzF family phenazine biosynthesis protein [Marinagarivorans algicola]|uniref:PhzF family phenazine biosynthesis protein n=1 Tax=Marinagarivorans algicola TaxID=1513270 RepID=UPI0006B6537C|nr:PhzF family phenazine biosynthesis protein [Marinagarivorans algicola]